MEHDAAYQHILSFPEAAEQMLRSYVPSAWLNEINWSTLERVGSKYHVRARYDGLLHRETTRGASKGRRRNGYKRGEGDIVYRVAWKDGRECFFYIFVEIQSAPQQFFAMRMLLYLGMFYDQYIREHPAVTEGELPLVWPIVLYTGNARWPYKLDTLECLHIPPQAVDTDIWPCLPRFKYHLIEQAGFDLAYLEKLDNLMGWMAGLETSRQARVAARLANRLAKWVREGHNEPLQRAAAVWLNAVFLPGKGKRLGITRLKNVPITEAGEMIAENIKIWEEQLRDEGRIEGEQKGLERGLREAVKVALEFKFAAAGVKFWKEHFESRDLAAWSDILSAVKTAENLAALNHLNK